MTDRLVRDPAALASARTANAVLTLDEAMAICTRALEIAARRGFHISVAVCDAGGRLIVFARMDSATWASGLGSQGKALASAVFGMYSGEVGRRAEDPAVRRIIEGILSADDGRMIAGKGGVPIVRDGRVIGACGVGGASADEDEECAAAAVESTRQEGLTDG